MHASSTTSAKAVRSFCVRRLATAAYSARTAQLNALRFNYSEVAAVSARLRSSRCGGQYRSREAFNPVWYPLCWSAPCSIRNDRRSAAMPSCAATVACADASSSSHYLTCAASSSKRWSAPGMIPQKFGDLLKRSGHCAAPIASNGKPGR